MNELKDQNRLSMIVVSTFHSCVVCNVYIKAISNIKKGSISECKNCVNVSVKNFDFWLNETWKVFGEDVISGFITEQ